MYKLLVDQDNKPYAVLKDGIWSIPFDPANTDYQEYLKFLAEGNEPSPPDSQE